MKTKTSRPSKPRRKSDNASDANKESLRMITDNKKQKINDFLVKTISLTSLKA